MGSPPSGFKDVSLPHSPNSGLWAKKAKDTVSLILLKVTDKKRSIYTNPLKISDSNSSLDRGGQKAGCCCSLNQKTEDYGGERARWAGSNWRLRVVVRGWQGWLKGKEGCDPGHQSLTTEARGQGLRDFRVRTLAVPLTLCVSQENPFLTLCILIRKMGVRWAIHKAPFPAPPADGPGVRLPFARTHPGRLTRHLRPSTVSSSKPSPTLKLISVVRTVVAVLM